MSLLIYPYSTSEVSLPSDMPESGIVVSLNNDTKVVSKAALANYLRGFITWEQLPSQS